MGPVLPVFVLDPHLTAPAGAVRRVFLHGCLRALDQSLGGALVVRRGRRQTFCPRWWPSPACQRCARPRNFGPYGRTRDAAVAERLAAGGVELELIESPYQVPPGTVTKSDGSPYRVFTPFYRAWREHADSAPAAAADGSRVSLTACVPMGSGRAPDRRRHFRAPGNPPRSSD